MTVATDELSVAVESAAVPDGTVGNFPVLLDGELDRRLGDPNDPTRVFSHVRCLELDEREEFPGEICAALDAVGLTRFYVPSAHGGSLRSYEELAALLRVVARRDLTVAIAHGKTFLGTAPSWVAATPEQATRLANDVLSGVRVALALTEPDHGSDLLATEVRAVPDAGGYRLTGTKWLINNATRGHQACVLARTDPAGGPRGMSLLLVDKRTLPQGSYRCLPKEPTHGIRAADISGLDFRDAFVPADALLGRPGGGLEIILKALQLTRTGCTALSLGAADQALELATRFAVDRELYGGRLVELPNIRHTLGRAYAQLFIAEAVSVVANRSIHVLPGEMSVVSAVAKSLVPTLVDEVIDELGELLGARSFLRGVYAGGRYQKVERDHRIVAIFDGSTVVNRNALINQFDRLARAYRRGHSDRAGLATALRLGSPVPPLEPRRLGVISRTGCSLLQSLPDAVRHVRALVAEHEIPARLAAAVDELSVQVDELHMHLAQVVPHHGGHGPEAFDLARRYELCLAGAACVSLWLANHRRVPIGSACVPWAGGEWLATCLEFLLGRLDPARPPHQDMFLTLFEAVARSAARGPVSILPRYLTKESDGR
ncbi:Acyl-CoA dehydrogenase [Micromonospora pallida]|uniref:Acyl-CoA dehydrogenase n=1 Tax=Micromonospora pallida TaxID=145854 RepID=A0A1C6RU32_9ACTN|nr:acyl-CoA dehydrogenase family protein [Micromonospora pallida]SCL20728.1 Acyl-CoA dehydrogenase [Micromonospora pallida]